MERRLLLKTAVLASAGVSSFTAFPYVIPNSSGRPYCSGQPSFDLEPSDTLLSQSGIYGRELFAFGVLRCKNTKETQTRITEIRSRTGFRCNLSYNSSNKYKIPFFEALLDDWVTSGQIKMYFRILKPSNYEKMTATQHISGYVRDLTNTIAMGNGLDPKFGRIVKPQAYKNSDDQSELDTLIASRNPRAKIIENVSLRNCDLLQFLATTTATIRQAVEHQPSMSKRDRSKAECLTKLRSALHLGDIATPLKTPTFEVSIQ